MRIVINVESRELDKFIGRMVLDWWESHDEGCNEPDCESIIDWINEHIEEEARVMMNVLGTAYALPYTDVIFKLNGQTLDDIVQNDKLQKIIDKHWNEMIKELP